MIRFPSVPGSSGRRLPPPGQGRAIEALLWRHLVALVVRVRARLRRALRELAAWHRVAAPAPGSDGGHPGLALREIDGRAGSSRSREAPDTRPAGWVALVGAGPGSADLLTLRALRRLGEADVIVHDRLVSDEVLALGRRDAERIYVGKACGRHGMAQEAINALLVDLARRGKRVVRLKGGDPFIFGRGGEEAAALAEAGVAFEVVPGITAALACAAEAKIALTRRRVARTLTLVTGQGCEGRLDLDFAALARPGQTLAVYMGMRTLPQLTRGLLAAGLDPATPAAIVEGGGTGAARCLVDRVGTLVESARGWATGRPAIVVIGEAVRTARAPGTAQPAVRTASGRAAPGPDHQRSDPVRGAPDRVAPAWVQADGSRVEAGGGAAGPGRSSARPRDGRSDPGGVTRVTARPARTGAGEGIRTLDPNLGKVVLYP